MTKSLRDYLQFIKFEKNLVALIRERRKLKHIPQKKANIEVAVLNRIKILYKQTVQRFPEHVQVWDEYLQFCKVYKFGTEVSPLLDRMMQFHADKPETWQKAIMWEYEETKNKDRVKHFVLAGLQRHPKNDALYFTFIKLKLLEGAQLKDAEAQKKVIAQTELIYKDGKENIGSIEFVVGVLEIVSRFAFARSFEVAILADMQTSHRDSELMWHTLAQRELSGRHLNGLAEEKPTTVAATDPNKRIELCVTIYQTACELLNTAPMYSYYADTIFELNEIPSIPAEVKRKEILAAFEAGYKQKQTTEENFLKFIEIASQDRDMCGKEKLLQVLSASTQQFPKSLPLWEITMRFHIEYHETDELALVFRAALKQMPISVTYPLWELLLLFYKSDDRFASKVKSLYREAIDLAVSEVSNPLKPAFLEYLLQTEGIAAARGEYNKLCLVVPSSLELHQKMAQLEGAQEKPQVTSWRKCHEMATQFFGKADVDVWLAMIEFEKAVGEPKRVSALYQRAMSSLEPTLVGVFITKFNLNASKAI